MQEIKYHIAEVPLIGYSLDRNPWKFGITEFFNSNIGLELYVSYEDKKLEIESILQTQASKGTVKTMLYGVGSLGGFVYTGSFVSSIVGIWGICPYCVPALAIAAGPFAGIPILLTGGLIIGKRLGQKRIMKSLTQKIKDAKPIIMDYSPFHEIIDSLGLRENFMEYLKRKSAGTKLQRAKKLFRKDTKLRELRVDIAEGLSQLEMKAMELSKKEPIFEVHKKTYEYAKNVYRRKILKGRKIVIFG